MTTMFEQLSFKLPIKVARERDAFVSVANANAVATLEEPATWPLGKMILLGPKACGNPIYWKSGLARTGHKDQSFTGF